MFLFSSLRWRKLLISVKYQQTAWWHFNLNFDKLSYFGQKCKHWQGQGISQVLLNTYMSSYQHWGFSSRARHQVIKPQLATLHHYISLRFTLFFYSGSLTGVVCCWCGIFPNSYRKAPQKTHKRGQISPKSPPKEAKCPPKSLSFSQILKFLISILLIHTSPYTLHHTYTHVTYARVSVRFG